MRAGGRGAGRIAALLCALQPGLAAYSHYIYSETLFTALLTGAAYLWYRSPRPGRSAAVGAGVLFGLAALTRSVAFYFLPVWLGWLVLRRRWSELRRVALLAGVTLAVVLPWTIRNALVFHDFILIDGTLGRTAWWAYNDAPLDVVAGRHRRKVGVER